MRTSKRGFGRLRAALVLIAVALAAGGALWYRKSLSADNAIDLKTAARTKVIRDNLTVTVIQAGELEAKQSKPIANETDRSRKIMSVIEDGAKVKKGDLLLELDSADLKDELLRLQAELSNADSELRKAQEDLEINRVKYQSDLKSAQLKLELAKLDLKKYEEAEYPQLQRQCEVAITLAKEDLKAEESRLEWTKKLFDKGYANRQDLEKNKLSVTRMKLDLQKAQEDLRILKEYTRTKDLSEKRNAITTARADLERVIKTNTSQEAQAKANLEARRTALDLKRKEVQKKQEDIDKMRVVSQWDGQVFYAKQEPWRDTKIEKGADVYGRQKILEFPDLSAWWVKTRIPESIIEKIKIGQEGVATVDAISNNTLKVRVSRTGAVADKGWWDSTQKVYPVVLDCLTTTTALKPGMSVMVEIIINRLSNQLQVPLQAVTTEGEKQYVYLIGGNKVHKTEVKTGENSESMIVVKSGTKEGDEVLLYAPVGGEKRIGQKESPLEQASRDKKKEGEAGTQGEKSAGRDKAPEKDKTGTRRENGTEPRAGGGGAGFPASPAPASSASGKRS